MKNIRAICAILIAFPTMVSAQQDALDRFTFSARFGLNISAKFGNPPTAIGNSRTTPDQLPFNYDDGYVLTDISGNFGGQTWNWGYDSSSQKSGDSILLSRSSLAASSGASTFGSDPAYGAELVYNRQLGATDKFRYGLETAVNYLSVSLSENNSMSANVTRVTDAYPFTPGTTPPPAPYEGTFKGSGFLVGDTSINSSAMVVAGNVTDRKRFDSDIWGLRLGPYVELPVWRRLNFAASAGLALGLVDGTVSWERTFSVAGGSSTSSSSRLRDQDLLWGGYAAGSLLWGLSPNWSAVGSVQYQYLGTYKHSVGNRQVELDLSKSVFFTMGLAYHF